MVLRRDYADYRWAMTQLFAEVDPLGLIEHHSGFVDEYESQVSDLLRWRTRVTRQDVLSVLGNLDVETADLLVRGIAGIRRAYGYEPEGA